MFVLLKLNLQANGIYRDGVGARSMAMGGTETGSAADALGAMAANPAGLGFLTDTEFQLGIAGAVTEGNFNKASISNGNLNDSPNALPEAALAVPLGKTPFTVGLSFIPDSALLANWTYVDPPGGLGGTTSYGLQTHKSEIILLRSAVGIGVQLGSKLAVGANVGLVYNENTMQSPYTFQNLQPNPNSLNGAKTLLDLHTSGFGVNAEVGLLFRPLANLQFGLAYKSPTTVNSTGDATGDPYAQFDTSPGQLAFHYDAAVKTKFPQTASIGMNWQFHPRWQLALQMDWINWSSAFDNLPVSLKNGSNPGVNAALGSSFKDTIPLNWSDEFVYRAGVEFAVTDNLFLRGGYAYGQNPVPDDTLTPLTAAILEHTVTAGIGYRYGRYQFDLAYQYELPASRHVGTSGLLAGEYSNSTTDVSVHVFALTTRVSF
jgi:long-chain fatty acid transport protein